VGKRLVAEVLYGIQASESVVLTKIARVLEERISVKKTEERLSRQLGREGLGERVQRNLLVHGASQVDRDTLLIFDGSDLRKPYAKKMEHLCTIRDGSAPELGSGYWMGQVVGAEIWGDRVIPLYGGLYSSEAPDFVSENQEWKEVIGEVSEAVGRRGLWVIDRGGDRGVILEFVLDGVLRFLIRMRGDRHLVVGHQRRLVEEVARDCRCPYTETVVKEEDGGERVYTLRFGFQRVRLPERGEWLGLVVVHGLGQEPLMLLTTEPLRRSQKVLWRVIRAYFRRWAIEETIRFIKQSYELEDVRVLGYRSLQNLLPLVTAASYFAAVVLDGRAKLRIMAGYVFQAAKRLFGIPDFRYYAIADGLQSIFQRHPGRIYAPGQAFRDQQQSLLSLMELPP
jgi:hypothetical protein